MLETQQQYLLMSKLEDLCLLNLKCSFHNIYPLDCSSFHLAFIVPYRVHHHRFMTRTLSRHLSLMFSKHPHHQMTVACVPFLDNTETIIQLSQMMDNNELQGSWFF